MGSCLLPLCSLVAGCGGDAPSKTPVPSVDLVQSLTEPGPYAVGYTQDEVVWDDPLSGERTLRLALWYPTEATTGDTVNYAGFVPAEGVLGGAPPADQAMPVVVFSHGHQGFAENSGFLMEHLASHGYLVAAPDHTDNTSFDGSERRTAIYYQRPLDISAVLDHLEALPVSHPLAGRPADGPILAIGHSFGGYTLLALAGAVYDAAVLDDCPNNLDDGLCSDLNADSRALFDAGFREPRIGAFVNMAAGDFGRFGADGIAAIEAPVLMMTATLDQPAGSEADQLWAALSDGDDLGVVLEGGGHQSFTDFADILEDVDLDAEAGFLVVDGYVAAWARQLHGDPAVAPVLSGERLISADGSLRE